MTHILCIQAEGAERELLCETLRNRLAYEVVDLAPGREALRHVLAERGPKPDLILLDVTGIHAAGAVGEMRAAAPHTPILALIPETDEGAGRTVLSAGAQDFMSKPVVMERLAAALRDTLVRAARRQGESFVPENQPPAAPATCLLIAKDGHVRRMTDVEAEVIRFAVHYYGGRMTEVARRLGIGRSTLYRKLGYLTRFGEPA